MKTTNHQLLAAGMGRVRGLAAPRLGLCLVLAATFVGCAHLGPRTVSVDRFDYSTSIADSWKQQTLLNVVKLRYVDLPVFVDVSSIVAGYSMETSASAGMNLYPQSALKENRNNFPFGVQSKFTDRPTITYVPMTGEKFLRGLITPIEPKNIFFMLQAGYAADFILGLSVESLNGVRNRSVAAGTAREADPEFNRVLALIREAQMAGAIGMRVEEDKAKGSAAVLFFRREDMSAEVMEKMIEIRRLLNLPADGQRFVLKYSPLRGEEGELAVNSRSLLQIMGAMASFIDVPDEHVRDRSAIPVLEDAATENRVRIRSGKDKPAQAYVAVRYRGHWFWIEDSNWQTKRALSAIVFLFTLANSGGDEKLPLITIPAQ